MPGFLGHDMESWLPWLIHIEVPPPRPPPALVLVALVLLQGKTVEQTLAVKMWALPATWQKGKIK